MYQFELKSGTAKKPRYVQCNLGEIDPTLPEVCFMAECFLKKKKKRKDGLCPNREYIQKDVFSISCGERLSRLCKKSLTNLC